MPALNTDKFKKLSRRWVGQIGAGGVADSVTTTVPLSSATNLATDTAALATIDRVDVNGVATPTLEETVIGVVSGSSLVSCVRGSEGTAQAHNAGAVVEILVTSKGYNDIVDGVLVEHNQDGTHKTPVVTLTGTQTLTNKTLTKPTLNGSVQAVTADTDAATITFSMAASNYHTVTLGGNRTLAVSNVSTGQPFILRLLQDGTGSRTVTWFATIKWAGGVAPTLTTTASKADVFGLVCTGSNTYDGFVVGQNL